MAPVIPKIAKSGKTRKNMRANAQIFSTNTKMKIWTMTKLQTVMKSKSIGKCNSNRMSRYRKMLPRRLNKTTRKRSSEWSMKPKIRSFSWSTSLWSAKFPCVSFLNPFHTFKSQVCLPFLSIIFLISRPFSPSILCSLFLAQRAWKWEVSGEDWSKRRSRNWHHRLQHVPNKAHHELGEAELASFDPVALLRGPHLRCKLDWRLNLWRQNP